MSIYRVFNEFNELHQIEADYFTTESASGTVGFFKDGDLVGVVYEFGGLIIKKAPEAVPESAQVQMSPTIAELPSRDATKPIHTLEVERAYRFFKRVRKVYPEAWMHYAHELVGFGAPYHIYSRPTVDSLLLGFSASSFEDALEVVASRL